MQAALMHNASTGPGNRSLFQGWKGGKIALTTPLAYSAPKGAQLESLDKTCFDCNGSHPHRVERIEETRTMGCQEPRPLLHLLWPPPPPPTISPLHPPHALHSIILESLGKGQPLLGRPRFPCASPWILVCRLSS